MNRDLLGVKADLVMKGSLKPAIEKTFCKRLSLYEVKTPSLCEALGVLLNPELIDLNGKLTFTLKFATI